MHKYCITHIQYKQNFPGTPSQINEEEKHDMTKKEGKIKRTVNMCYATVAMVYGHFQK